MRRIDIFFLVCVSGCASLFAVQSAMRAVPLLPTAAVSETARAGTAGRARDVDMAKLKALLERGALSEHEALHYQRMGAGDHPGTASE